MIDIVNAIGKARFSAAKPQRVQLHRGGNHQMDLLCFEAGQKLPVAAGTWTYYVITGAAAISGPGQEVQQVPQGQLAAADQPHTVTNAGERRLVCLACGPADK
jgi:hypothetical protein